MPHSRHPNSWDLSLRDSPQNIYLEKQWSLHSQDPKVLFLKDSCADSFTPRLRAKAAFWKVLRLCMKKIHLLTLKPLPEGRGPGGTLWDEDVGGHIFALSFYLTNTSRHMQLMRPPAASLKLANMPCPHVLSLLCWTQCVMWFLCSSITLLKPRCTHHPCTPQLPC